MFLKVPSSLVKLLLRDRLDIAIENEEIQFIRQYRNETGAWVTMTAATNITDTNEQGIARFEWPFDGRICDGVECTGEWQVIASMLEARTSRPHRTTSRLQWITKLLPKLRLVSSVRKMQWHSVLF